MNKHICSTALILLVTTGQAIADPFRGVASWYETGSRGGAASKTLAFGTRVRVTSMKNHRSVVVTINDRGPYVQGRDIDLSVSAANTLGFYTRGTVPVTIQVLGRDHRYRRWSWKKGIVVAGE